ncbi:hypothetical protein ACFL20_09600 [Spirochaetota bacterium]
MNLLDKINTIQSNPHYRVADVFYSSGERWQDSANKVLRLPEFEDTILKKYLVANKGCREKNYDLLKDIIEQHAIAKSYLLPHKNELVLHVRAGDVVVHEWFLKKDYISLISIALDRNPNITTITIVTCFAYQAFPEKLRWMYSDEKDRLNRDMLGKLLSDIYDKFRRYELKIVSNENVDEDLCYMFHANYFIPDGGKGIGWSGFSHLIEELRFGGYLENDHPNLLTATPHDGKIWDESSQQIIDD